MSSSSQSSNKARIAMISGHMDLSPSEFQTGYHSLIDAAIARGDSFIVGSARGADELSVSYILKKYPTALKRITVYASRAHEAARCRTLGISVVYDEAAEKNGKGRKWHIERDERMTAASDYDILWIRSEEESRKLYGEKYRKRVSGTEMNRLRRMKIEKERAQKNGGSLAGTKPSKTAGPIST